MTMTNAEWMIMRLIDEDEVVCSEFGGVGIAYFDADGNWYGDCGDVTHWMPLPEPQEDDSDE